LPSSHLKFFTAPVYSIPEFFKGFMPRTLPRFVNSPATIARLPPARVCHIDAAKYKEMYAASIADPEAFWGEHGKRIDWIKPYTKVKDTSFAPGNISINWFEDGTLNVCGQLRRPPCRHARRPDGDHLRTRRPERRRPSTSPTAAAREVCKMANILEDMGVRKGDRVILYLPMIPEAAYAMLACARIGAIHSIVFAGFSPDALGATGSTAATPRSSITADERSARGPQDGAEIEHRRRASALHDHVKVPGGQAHRRADHVDRRARLRLQRAAPRGRRHTPRRR
jgi:acetyl-CoA synthetase